MEEIVKREYLRPYQILQAVDEAIKNKKPLPFDEIHFIGSKLSGKTYAVLKCLCENAMNDSEVEVRAYRFRQTDIRKFAYDINTKLQKMNHFFKDKIGFDSGRNTRGVFYNGNKIEIQATDTPRKKELGAYGGLDEFSKTYGFAFFEEMFEYPEQNYKEITGAFRGAKYMMNIHCSNPWKERSWYVRKMLKYLPWNDPLMKTRGWNATKLTIKDEKYGINDKKIAIIWTNWRVNKQNLTQKDITSIMNFYDVSEQAGETADFGKAGSESSGVYIDKMHRINLHPKWTRASRVGGGGDIGVGKSKKSGLTAFIFGEYDFMGNQKVLKKWKWDMKKNAIGVNNLYSMVVDFYQECWMMFQAKAGQVMKDGAECEVRVDLSNQEFIDNCNVEADKRGLTWLVFVPCSKGKIWPRIWATWKQMDTGKLQIDEDEVPELLEEMEASEFVDVEGQKVRKNENDHFINAFEYWQEPEQEEGLLTDGLDESIFNSNKW